MKGRKPKPAGLRQRRNAAPTRAVLKGSANRTPAPPLPKGRDWNDLSRQWWEDIWSSPMAPEYLETDSHGLYRLALLIDQFWLDPDVKLAAEIRQEQAAYGLSPLDRRRLEWTIEKTEQEKARRKPPRSRGTAEGEDPRNVLRPNFKSA